MVFAALTGFAAVATRAIHFFAGIFLNTLSIDTDTVFAAHSLTTILLADAIDTDFSRRTLHTITELDALVVSAELPLLTGASTTVCRRRIRSGLHGASVRSRLWRRFRGFAGRIVVHLTIAVVVFLVTDLFGGLHFTSTNSPLSADTSLLTGFADTFSGGARRTGVAGARSKVFIGLTVTIVSSDLCHRGDGP